ncbi:MAG TPA: hypothetical protein VFC13_18055 [Actinomycetes bacterium]|nr:hypothetical protein [Actinomycetes bacterium]
MGSRLVDDQVVELRVHGVSGTPPERMLDDPHPKQVAGDDDGRVFRRSHPLEVELGGSERVVEAFHWGRFTAGSATRALWLLLLPFAVVNLARYALLMPERRRPLDRTADLVLRLLGLMLTLTFVVTSAYLALDVVARQCGISPACVSRNRWLSWFVDRSFGVRLLVASILPALVLTLVWWFGRQTFQHDPPGPKREPEAGNGSFADLMFWRGAASAPLQRAAHAMAGCAVLGAMAVGVLGDPAQWLRDHRSWDDRTYLGLLGLCGVLFLVALALVVANHQPKLEDIRPDRAARDSVALPRVLKWTRRFIAVPLAAGCVIWSSVQLGDSIPAATRALTGLEMAANVAAAITGGLLLVLLGICVAMVVSTPGRRLRTVGVPRAFRPYWHGLGAWVLAALAAMFASGFSTAAVFWVAGLLGRPVLAGSGEAVPEGTLAIDLAVSYWTGALVWGSIAALAALLLLPLLAWLLRRRAPLVGFLVLAAAGIAGAAVAGYDGADLLSDQAEWLLLADLFVLAAAMACAVPGADGFPATVSGDYDDGDPQALRRGTARVIRGWRITIARHRYHHALGALAAVGGVLVLAAAGVAARRIADPGWRDQPPEVLQTLATGPLGPVGVAVVTAIAAGLVALGVATWRNPAIRTTTGILWDLVSFWPRLAHPLCPPPYGGRAVLGVAVRASQLVNALKARTVVLSGHSQGSVITAAACAVLAHQAEHGAEDRAAADGSSLDANSAAGTLARLRMVTYGSQLQFIYARLFPTYVGFERLRSVYADALGGRWRHLYRWTDPLGGPVLSWPAGRTPPYGPTVPLWTFMSCADHGPCPGHPPERRERADPGGTRFRWWRIGSDVRLRDPDVMVENATQPRSPMRGHSGHEADPVFDLVVDELD